MALSRVHDILNRESRDGAVLGGIVRHSVAPLGDSRRGRCTVGGPELRIPPGMALSIVMALHELCTNAARYGALRDSAGQVAIRSRLWRDPWAGHDTGGEPRPPAKMRTAAADQGRLHVHWGESGAPPVQPPATEGFGTRLIERGLARELGGSAWLDFAPGGVVCEIDAALP